VSHDNARAFGTIMTTMWPMGKKDVDYAFLNLAVHVTASGDQQYRAAEMLGALDFCLQKGATPHGAVARLTAWRASCMVVGCLTTTIEIRLDLLIQHLKGNTK
jgi:hypothetical protein